MSAGLWELVVLSSVYLSILKPLEASTWPLTPFLPLLGPVWLQPQGTAGMDPPYHAELCPEWHGQAGQPFTPCGQLIQMA